MSRKQAIILPCADERIAAADLAAAAAALRDGRLVVFPTETVYGLGANALDATAVMAIYTAKGRPSGNPLIVHVASSTQAQELATDWPECADRLSSTFWPGPLTLVLRKRPAVPPAVTGGGETVAVRCPGHPVALRLVTESGVPIAAPSANPSGYVSPTRVEHLAPEILSAAAYVLDAGPCPGGIESTVVDVTAEPLRILRPGPIAPADLERAAQVPVLVESAAETARPRSPGTLGRHYAPRARVVLASTLEHRNACLSEWAAQGASTACLLLWPAPGALSGVTLVPMPETPQHYARVLYDRLVQLDRAGVEVILVDMPPDDEAWLAIRDRLRRAAFR